MKFRVLLILMWKHFIVRKRRFILTTVELLSPIFFFVILFLFRQEINPVSKYAAQGNYENVIRPEAISFEMASKPANVWFTPDTETTRLLMEKVRTKFRGAYGTKFMPYSEDINFLNQTKGKSFEDNDVLIIFENPMGSSLPETLNYTLRFNNVFMTHTYESLNEHSKPNSGFGIIYEPFLTLQWAIDTSYLELKTGVEVKQRLTLQEFPYAEPKGNTGITLLCSTLKSICFLSLLLNFVTLLTRLLEERCSGIKELMKMKGLHSYQLAVSHFLNVLPPALVFAVVGAILLTVGDNPLLKYSNGFLLFLTLLLYSLTIISMAFVCSYIPNSTQYGTTLAVLVYIGLWLPVGTLIDRDIGRTLALLTGLLPHQPMVWVWKEAEELEKYGQGITFSTMARSHSKVSGSVLAAYALMLIQTLILFALTMYLDLVRPGKYGQAIPWNFFCQKNYWRKNDIIPDSEMDELEDYNDSNQMFFENAPHNQGLGIKIVNVSKVFSNKQRALDNVSLDVYQGEITVLLGHNGAGKTTLMSIITGMISPTTGRVEVNGVDVSSDPHAARKRLGLCPQHNIVLTDLTVLENVMFFTLLKGGSFFNARTDSEKLLGQLGILSKKNNRSMELSGGMKRRLQLACALAGNSDVLILDEPTSGLDVETRRELWDLLLSLRKSRTVLLSTHFMEEADALGDRVAALHAGHLRCNATPLHLKKAIGTGYRLTFTTKGVPKEDLITSAVTSHVDSATVKETSFNSISYNLPATSSDKFPQLFADLENKRWELSIESIGVGVSTLEEVFLKLCSDVNKTFTQEDDTDVADNATERGELVYLTGSRLYANQFVVLLKRQINYIMTKIQAFLILEVFLPILMIVLTFNIFNGHEAEIQKGTMLSLDLDLYNTLPERSVLYDVNGSDSGLRAISDRYPGVLFQRTSDIDQFVLRTSKERIMDYGKYLIGMELNDTHAKVLYTTTVRHTAPIGLNMLSNLIASRMPSLSAGIIHTNNQPIDGKLTNSSQNEPKSLTSAIMSVVIVTFIILAACIHAAALPCKELVSGARHLHIMAGVPAALYWASTLLTHTVLALLTLVVPTAITAALVDNSHTFTEPVFIGSLSLTILLGCMAFFALTYLISFYCGENGSSFLLVLIIIVFGLILPVVKSVGDVLKPTESTTFLGMLLTISSYVVPPHSLTVAAGEVAVVARLNALCELNRHHCPQLMIAELGFDAEKCCASTGNPYCFFCTEKTAPAIKMLALAIQCAVLMVLVVLTELTVFKALYEKIMNARFKIPPRSSNDAMVRAERAYVEKAIALPTKQITDAMLASDLHKNYKLIGKSCYAVKGISFSVKKGECFGLLGVNGAGKSSTFKVLTGEEWPTRGQVVGHGYHLQREMREYLTSLGYCPQFFGLDEFQTGYDNLALLLTLRGLKSSDIDAEVKSWIKVVGLEKYASRRVFGYSGGCMRRLAAAAALCRGAAITLLDEPTAGVDVAARRRVWVALRRGLAQKRSIVITSHSMDEMEALCNRIAIMSEGMICALGSPAALRAAYASGHAVIIKVKHTSPSHQAVDETDSGQSQLHQLKGLLNQKFNCTLKDEHKTMLHYHINETLHYSELFQELEALKKLFPHLVEDYSVTETTLEEVFLSFAKNPPEANVEEATAV